jgi:hypothetical protein
MRQPQSPPLALNLPPNHAFHLRPVNVHLRTKLFAFLNCPTLPSRVADSGRIGQASALGGLGCLNNGELQSPRYESTQFSHATRSKTAIGELVGTGKVPGQPASPDSLPAPAARGAARVEHSRSIAIGPLPRIYDNCR